MRLVSSRDPRVIEQQRDVCKKYGLAFVESPNTLKVGIAENVKSGLQPINGLRHYLVGDTSGWYIWAGEDLQSDPEFFKPVHIEHLDRWCPKVLKYLGLPPGSRFLVSEDYEDVWSDPSLLRS